MNLYYFYKGRVALYAILKSIGIGHSDEVLLPGFTCIVVPNAITYLGGVPVFIDINPITYNINFSKIEENITYKTKAIIVQHTFGIPSDMDRIIEIAKKYNLYVIEDSCHTIGSKYKGKEVGTFGDAAFFSSQWSKPVTTGLGGWAIINNLRLKEKMERIYPQFIKPSFGEELMLRLQYFIYSKLYSPSLFWLAQNTYRTLSKYGIMIGSSTSMELECRMPGGYEKKMSNWQKKLLHKKLKEIDEKIEYRKYIVSIYRDLFKKKGLPLLDLSIDYQPVYLRYPFLVKNKKEIIEEAKKRHLEIGDWFVSPVHPNLKNWSRIGYKTGSCPISEKICSHIINLPTHENITKKMALKIVDFIAQYQDILFINNLLDTISC